MALDSCADADPLKKIKAAPNDPGRWQRLFNQQEKSGF